MAIITARAKPHQLGSDPAIAGPASLKKKVAWIDLEVNTPANIPANARQ
jgi:hypothetical protein